MSKPDAMDVPTQNFARPLKVKARVDCTCMQNVDKNLVKLGISKPKPVIREYKILTEILVNFAMFKAKSSARNYKTLSESW